MSDARNSAAFIALREALPTAAQVEALIGSAGPGPTAVPIVDGRLAPPFQLQLNGTSVTSMTLEVYDQKSPLARVSQTIYRTILSHPAFASLERLDIDAVACIEVPGVHLLGDPIPLLARHGLPSSLKQLGLTHPAMVTHAEDVGYLAMGRLTPLHQHLGALDQLDIASCTTLGALALPKLRRLRLWWAVTARNLRELARADLPALERLELTCDPLAEYELRYSAVRALLYSNALPALFDLELVELDVPEDQYVELDEEARDPKPWAGMIAKSPMLRRLRRLALSFHDIDREADQLVAHADAFAHLDELVLERGEAIRHPTREAVARQLRRA